MKKILSILLALLLLSANIVGMAEAVAPVDPDAPVETVSMVDLLNDLIGLQEGTELVMGTATAMNGCFAFDMFGSNSSDMDVRSLLHGYSTVTYAQSQSIIFDETVVTAVDAAPGTGTNEIYTFTLSEELRYNNGQAITAKDYLFSLLLQGAPEIAQIGGMPRGMDFINGYSAYQAGTAQVLAGVRLLSDYSFSIEVLGSQLPYFYGLALLNVSPSPMNVIAPGCDIFDDGAGVYIGAAGNAATLTADGYAAGQFSADMLRVTLLDPVNGYVYNPRVTAGPYQLESFNAETNEVVMTVNREYLGNYEGMRPHIARLVYKLAGNDTIIEQFKNGELGLLHKILNIAVSDEAMLLSQEGTAKISNYPRSGLAMLAFACEQSPTSSQAVRNAIAHCIDKTALINETIGANLGLAVHGYYGLGQWMLNQPVPESVTRTEAQALAMTLSDLIAAGATVPDLEAAKKLLADDGWTLNASGDAFADGVDPVRYRRADGQLVPLTLKWAKSEGSKVADAIETQLAASLPLLGIGIEITAMPFEEMLKHYYSEGERAYNMFFLASDFQYVFDPYYDYNTGDEFQGLVNTSRLKDTKLMTLAEDMRNTLPTDVEVYLEKWVAFQNHWMSVMPLVPLYSNVYLDVSVNNLQGFDMTLHGGLGYALLYSYIADEPIENPEAEGEGLLIL